MIRNIKILVLDVCVKIIQLFKRTLPELCFFFFNKQIICVSVSWYFHTLCKTAFAVSSIQLHPPRSINFQSPVLFFLILIHSLIVNFSFFLNKLFSIQLHPPRSINYTSPPNPPFLFLLIIKSFNLIFLPEFLNWL